MSRRFIVVLAALVWLGVAPAANAGPLLFEWAVNQDGVVSDSLAGDPLPGNWNGAAFDFVTGLGTLTATITGVGPHSVRLFLDIEIDETLNTFFNEYGEVSGVPGAGQSWEIDEPGYVFGDIFTNFTTGTLDNSNGVPAATPDDVSVALGWDFVLAADERAILTFTSSPTAPPGGFYLRHVDTDSPDSIYFASRATILPIGVPEPATLLLLGTGLLMLGARVRPRR